jgi:eukaryotic-like serine/threonine-protein kinase
VADLLAHLQSALAGRYTVERELGRGGMATVYFARDLRHHRPVALKVLHPELSHALGAERFLREIEVAAHLTHSHILPLHDSGKAEELLYYVMPYIDGETLRHRLRREIHLPKEDAVRIAREVADALAYAHSQGVIHRDIKPENVLLHGGHALVADFGIARAVWQTDGGRLTETGLALGTVVYMSPEQASGVQVDGRSDVYSLGCVLYEMLAGEPPYTGPNAQAIIVKRLSDPVPSVRRVRPSVSPYLDGVVSKMLAPIPSDRFPTAQSLYDQLVSPAIGSDSGTVSTERRKAGLRSVVEKVRGPLLGGIVVGMAALLGYLAYHETTDSAATIPAADTVNLTARSTAAFPSSRSLAVLPLVNVSGDPDDEYFSDGMTDELAGALSKLPGLRVASRTSAFRFKGRRDVDVRTIGDELKVGTVLEGSVRRAGATLRLTAQLVSVSDGLTLWSETYERDLRDVFKVQVEIAQAVADQLELELGVSRNPPTASLGTRSVKAHDLNLRGRFMQARGTEKDLRGSLAFFDAAQREDPKYAAPHLGVAQAWMMLADDFVAPDEAWPKVRAAALRALERDSTLAEAHTFLSAALQWYDKDLTAAERELRRAMALNPNDANTRFNLGRLLVLTGRAREGLDEYSRATQLDPLSTLWFAGLAEGLLWVGEMDSARAAARQALALEPDFALAYKLLGDIHLAQDELEQAGEAYRRGEELGWTQARVGRAMVYAASGHADSARRIAQRWELEATRRWVAPDLIAGIYATLGDTDRAFRLLEQANREHAGYLLMLNVRPDLAPLRNDPRFALLARKLGLPQPRRKLP